MSESLPVTANGGAAVPTTEPPVGPMTDPLAVGQVMARSGLFPDITRVSQAVVKVLAGRELGIGPFAAMSDIHIIEGKPVIGARILAALVRQSPVRLRGPRVDRRALRDRLLPPRPQARAQGDVRPGGREARRARQAHARRHALQPHEVPARHEVRARDV
jgi:hypothetical protein